MSGGRCLGLNLMLHTSCAASGKLPISQRGCGVDGLIPTEHPNGAQHSYLFLLLQFGSRVI